MTQTTQELNDESSKPSSDSGLDSQSITVSSSQAEEKPEKSLQPEGSSEAGPSLWGQKARRKLNQDLKKQGVKESELPALLQDSVIKRSRKGKAGQIVVRALSGVQNSGATALARKLENELSGGREDVLEKLQASGTSNPSIQKLVQIYESNQKFSLARAIAEAKADVAVVLDSYAKGALALKKMETVLSIYKEMPHIMRDLMRHAIDEEETCGVCFGAKVVAARAGAKKLSQTCPRCKGTGVSRSSSEHKEFAVQKVLEMSEMLPKKQGVAVNVNQAVQVNAGGNSDLLARMSKAADEVLYHRPTVVDAEVVEEE